MPAVPGGVGGGEGGQDGESPVVLPSNLTKKDLHIKACKTEERRQLSLSSFRNI